MASLALYGHAAKQRQRRYSNEIAICVICRLIPSPIQTSQCFIFLGPLWFLQTVLADRLGRNGEPELRQIKGKQDFAEQVKKLKETGAGS